MKSDILTFIENILFSIDKCQIHWYTQIHQSNGKLSRKVSLQVRENHRHHFANCFQSTLSFDLERNMPDRVKMPRSVPAFYNNVYIQILESQDPMVTASAFIRAADKHIHKLGSGGNQLMSKIKSYLQPYSFGSLLYGIPVDWIELHDRIDLLAKEVKGDRFDIDRTLEAGHQVLLRLEKSEPIDVSIEIVVERYLAIWKAEIEEPPQVSDKELLPEISQAYLDNVCQNIAYEARNDFQNTKKVATSDLLPEDVFTL